MNSSLMYLLEKSKKKDNESVMKIIERLSHL
jgi:hypothetical protein